MSKFSVSARVFFCFTTLAFLIGCGGGYNTPPPPAVSVTVNPTAVTLVGGGSQTFTATVANDSTTYPGVTWTASTGAVSATGVYTAPQPVTTTTATVTATSKADATKSATATVTLTPIAVSVTPTTATLIAGATQTFVATVTADSANAGVTWTASTGTITAGGVYTAPTPVSTASATITATSKTDATKSATATVTLTPIAVSVTPTTATLIAGATQTFVATVTADSANAGVTWTASTGTITAAGVYTAPTPVSTASATITATSKTDATKSATATVTLTPISLSAISPASISLGTGGTAAFTDTVSNDSSNSGVSWSIGSGPGTLTASSSTGVTYNAPVSVIGAVTTVTLTATSIKDPTKTTTATITLNPVTISLTPTTPAAMIGGATQAFTATVANDGSNAGVTWSVTGGGSFSAASTLSGVATTYTSASPVSTASAVVTATSVKDPSKSASATITLTPIALSITSASPLSLDAGQTFSIAGTLTNDSSNSGANFTVTAGGGSFSGVTTSGTAISAVYTAPASLSVATAATITVASVKDPTKSSTIPVTLNPAMSYSPAAGALAAGVTGSAYPGATITAINGTGTKTYAVASGALPAGLTLNSSTGAISGTVTAAASTYSFVVRTTDSSSNPSVLNGSFTITVTTPPLVWVAPAAGTLTYTVGTPIAPINLSTTGGVSPIAYSLNSGSLPSGLSIVGGQITGTPTAPTVAAGNVVNFLATDSSTPTALTTVSANVTLVVNPVTLAITSASLPTGTTGAAYSYQLTSSGGTGAIAWTLSAGSLSGTGLTLSGTGLLSGTPTGTLSGLSLTFQAQDSTTNQQQTVTRTLSLTVSNALTITTTSSSLPNAYSGVAYPSTTLVAAGGTSPYTWSVTSGASGSNSLATLNLSVSSAGVITGTPSTTGTANFTVQVTDSASHTSTASYTVTAYTVLSLPTPNPSSLPSATISSSYSGSIAATGGVSPYIWAVNSSAVPTNNSAVSLSNGLSVSNNGNGTLNVSGTPTSTGTVTFTASVTDNAGTTVGPRTYTIAVASTYSITGQIISSAGCNSAGLSGVTVSVNTTPVTTATTDINGNFALSNIPNGSYTVTPSIAGPSSIFYPATQSITVTGANVSTSFNGLLGYTVSGTVAYSGTQTGQIYLSLVSSSGCGSGTIGTSIAAKGAFTIHGVPPGTYTLQAYLDTLGKVVPNAADPTGSVAAAVSTSNVTGTTVTLNDPATVTLASAPTLSSVAATNTAALAQFKAIKNGSGIEMATSYTLQWSTTSTFTAIAGSKTFPAAGTHTNVWLVNGFTDGTVYYFRAYGTSAGTATSPFSSVIGPITIGAPTGGNTVSGSVSFSGAAAGPLYVGFYDQNTNAIYVTYVANPVTAQAYTVQVPTGSAWNAVGIIDQNNNGVVDAGDISNVDNNSNNATLSISGNLANQNLALPTTSAAASVTTQNFKSVGGSSTSQSYQLNFQVRGLIKRPVAVSLASGPNAISPLDIALCGGTGSNCGKGFQINLNIGSVAPVVGDTYTFNVTYSDGTSGTLTASVTAVLSSFATSLAPTTGTSVSTTPTFTWTNPVCGACSTYLYSFNLNDQTGNTIWQIPGNNSNSNGFSSAITSITWGTDPTGGGSTPTLGSLSTSTNYSWQIQIQDSNGNSAVTQVNYQP
jgi:hypothetical protein